MISLVSGGARSGKSSFAENLVASYGDDICYIATAIAFDDGMQDRINKHREQRPSDWRTYEAYRDIADFIIDNRHQGYILDCVTIMITNLIFDSGYDFDSISFAERDQLEKQITEQFSQLLDAIDETGANFVFVTNELGSGIVPADRMTRYFRDVAGRINQLIANRADQVYLLVCGQALQIK